MTGQLMLLAGPSSTGKTTLGLSLIDALGDWLFWEVDRSGPRMPRASLIEPEQIPHLSAENLAAALRRQSRIVEANVTAVAAYVRAGFSVVAELFLWDEEHIAIASRVWEGLAPLVVELRCPVEVLEERERERQSVYLGTAREQAEQPWIIPRGLVLDSTEPPARLVEQVVAWLNSNPTTHWPVAGKG